MLEDMERKGLLDMDKVRLLLIPFYLSKPKLVCALLMLMVSGVSLEIFPCLQKSKSCQ